MMLGQSIALAFQDPEEVCSRSPFRILLVEDDDVETSHCETVLRQIYGQRLHLERVGECQDAVDRLNSLDFDACLLDDLIHGGSAMDVLCRVDFSAVNTPVIVISAFGDRDFVLEALRHGADDYVVRGLFGESDMHQAIQHAIYRKYKELRLRQRAFYDPLTGLANRHLFNDRLSEVHRFSVRHREKYALMMVDLDRLKQVNDQRGHEAGDRLIRAVALALRASMRASDTVARVGGDEFVAILKNVRDREGLTRLRDTVRAAVTRQAEEELALSDPVTCSIGIAVFPDDSTSPDEMLRLADAEMYAMKRAGRGGA